MWPDANVGIITGEVSGLVVVDLDNKDGRRGSDNLKLLVADHGWLPQTLAATTGNGEHLFFAHPGVEVRNSASTIAENVDVRGDGGYVVAAPSVHANGNQYTWRDPDDALAQVPPWLLTMMHQGKKRITTMRDEQCKDYADAPMVIEGTRNDTLYRLGCALRGQHGMDHGEITTILLEYNRAKCNPPLDEAEVIPIVESICKHPAEVSTSKSGKRLENSPLYWFPFNTREWFANQNIAMMSAEQAGWYIRLKAFAWDQGGFLPADHAKLAKLARAPKKRFERDCDLVLAEYEQVVVDGDKRLRNPAMAAHYATTLEVWMKRKDAGETSQQHKRDTRTAMVTLAEATKRQ